MLKLIIKGEEFWNAETEEFESSDDVEIELEHSLLSLSKWESKYKKPFLDANNKSRQEIFYYIEAMIISPNYSQELLTMLSKENIDEINAYIESTESATTFGEMPKVKGKGETITSELIYYWMVAFNIPFETELWHLNRLFSLIRICNIKNSKPRKMSRGELSRQYKDLNEKRKEKLGTKG